MKKITPSVLDEFASEDTFLKNIGIANVNTDQERRAELIWFSDAVYRGETGLFQGKKLRHGLGVMLYFSGRVYEGLWVKDKRHGKGMELSKNGDLYLGDFKKGRPHGKGKKTWKKTGEKYDGDWY